MLLSLIQGHHWIRDNFLLPFLCTCSTIIVSYFGRNIIEKDIYKNLYAIYTGPAGFDGDILEMEELEVSGVLERGTLYKVKKIDMGSSVTYVYLKNVQKVLNSVGLKFYEVTQKGMKGVDIYNDPRFNPYMRDREC